MSVYGDDTDRKHKKTLKKAVARAAGLPETVVKLPQTLDDWKDTLRAQVDSENAPSARDSVEP